MSRCPSDPGSTQVEPGPGSAWQGQRFAALGIGAILGAVALGRARQFLSTNATLSVAGVVLAAALALLVLVPSFVAVLVVLVLAGLAWTSTISTLIAELQLFMPRWVMARGMAIYTMIFTGCQAIGALVWGLVAQQVGLVPTFLAAGVLELVAVGIGLLWRVPDAGETAPDPVVYWSEARVAVDPDPAAGPIQVVVTYTIAPADLPAWLAAMRELRRSRLRTGATRWEIYRNAEEPGRYVEQFRVATWEEHQRQHDGRLTAADQTVEQRALGYSDPPALAEHLVPPG